MARSTWDHGDDNLYALTPSGVAEVDNMPREVDIVSSPAIGADGTIYVGSWDDNLYALTDNGTSGSLKWKYATGDAIDVLSGDRGGWHDLRGIR